MLPNSLAALNAALIHRQTLLSMAESYGLQSLSICCTDGDDPEELPVYLLADFPESFGFNEKIAFAGKLSRLLGFQPPIYDRQSLMPSLRERSEQREVAL